MAELEATSGLAAAYDRVSALAPGEPGGEFRSEPAAPDSDAPENSAPSAAHASALPTRRLTL